MERRVAVIVGRVDGCLTICNQRVEQTAVLKAAAEEFPHVGSADRILRVIVQEVLRHVATDRMHVAGIEEAPRDANAVRVETAR